MYAFGLCLLTLRYIEAFSMLCLGTGTQVRAAASHHPRYNHTCNTPCGGAEVTGFMLTLLLLIIKHASADNEITVFCHSCSAMLTCNCWHCLQLQLPRSRLLQPADYSILHKVDRFYNLKEPSSAPLRAPCVLYVSSSNSIPVVSSRTQHRQ